MDSGEWGGGLWLTNDDGSVDKEIANDNIRAIASLGSEFLVLTGLSHMSLEHGTALMRSNSHRMHVELEWAKILDSAPQTFTRRGTDSVFLTRYSIFQINRAGNPDCSPKRSCRTHALVRIISTGSLATRAPSSILCRLSSKATTFF